MTTVARLAHLSSEADADGSVGASQTGASSDRSVGSREAGVARASGVDSGTSSRAERARARSSREGVGSSGAGLALVSVGELASKTSFAVILGG